MIYLCISFLMGGLHPAAIIFDITLTICLVISILLLCITYDCNTLKKRFSQVRQYFDSEKEELSDQIFSDEEPLKANLTSHDKSTLYSSIYRELTHMMDVEKIYHDSKLTRDEVVIKLGTSKKVFLEALQHHVNMNFIDYVNTFRLNEAIALLENEAYTNETIAEIVGFGSANTFYRQFKLKYGLSPYEYKKNLNTFTLTSSHCKVEA